MSTLSIEEKALRRREFIQLFERSGWTQAQAGRELGVSRANINGIVTGEQSPGSALLRLFRLRVELQGSERRPANAATGAQDVPLEKKLDDFLVELDKLRQQMFAVKRAARRLSPLGVRPADHTKQRLSGGDADPVAGG